MLTIEEEIVYMLGALNAMSRRGGAHMPPPPMCENGCIPPPPPDAKGRGRGRVMRFLSDNGESCQSAIAAAFDIRPQSLSELISKMECDGLVVRRQSPEDRRQFLVSLTETGKNRVEAFRESHRRRAEEFLVPLTDEEKKTFSDILHRLVEAQRETQNGQNGGNNVNGQIGGI